MFITRNFPFYPKQFQHSREDLEDLGANFKRQREQNEQLLNSIQKYYNNDNNTDSSTDSDSDDNGRSSSITSNPNGEKESLLKEDDGNRRKYGNDELVTSANSTRGSLIV